MIAVMAKSDRAHIFYLGDYLQMAGASMPAGLR